MLGGRINTPAALVFVYMFIEAVRAGYSDIYRDMTYSFPHISTYMYCVYIYSSVTSHGLDAVAVC